MSTKTNNILIIGFLLCMLVSGCHSGIRNGGSELGRDDIKRIVLLGGSLVSGMEEHGFFEQSIFQYYADQDVSIRNIAWPGDDVYGLARSQFGSAQNTRSWQPPTAEEGFGSKVLVDHIAEANPSTLMIGYGSVTAFAENEEDFTLFTSGYLRILEFAKAQQARLILVSAPKQEVVFGSKDIISKRNEWLQRAHDFIKNEATKGGHIFVDLYYGLIEDPEQNLYTKNGVHLNRRGYEIMNSLILKELGISPVTTFTLKLDEKARIVKEEDCSTSNWTATVNGVSLNLMPGTMVYSGEIFSKEPVAIFVDGKLAAKTNDTISLINFVSDSLRNIRLQETIKEKNRLHRSRLQPLNEAYIYLFRRHEMGHLAYEMEDLNNLIKEKEREIKQLVEKSYSHFIEIELIKPWRTPKNYPEDEVPAFIPAPDIEAELAAFEIAEGFEIQLFASDPMIANPINMNWDTKGRAWVATSSTYPHIIPGREPNDKIVILEDTDGDGVADKHTVFAENLLIPHSVMPVPGGAYVTATTELLFLADTDGDDIADERHVVFDGFGNADVHHMIHGLRWMPWGDLHFTQSIYINSFVETAYGIQVLNGSGIWSFRPETKQLEVFSRGLINPWGEALDQWGQSFETDGAGSSGINYVFPGSAHATAVGAPEILLGLNENTPKYTSAEVIYSRQFPKHWQGSVITNDFRANRTVRYLLKPDKSGYQSEEVETVLRSDHRSYRPVDTKIGPDGALYIVDWYNPIIDHGEVDFHHPIRDRTHGRIWKLINTGRSLLNKINFSEKSTVDLLDLLNSPEQFTRMQANRAFVEKKGDPGLVVNWMSKLNIESISQAKLRVEGLWLLTALNHYDAALLKRSLLSSKPHERAAAVRLLRHWGRERDQETFLVDMINDPSPQVRLEAIHALREMGGLKAVEGVVQVLNHPLDANLEFALNYTLRQTKEDWLPELENGKNLFGRNRYQQLYALLTIEDSRVIGPINELLEQPDLDSSLVNKAWSLIAKIGDAETKSRVLDHVLKTKNAQLLKTMANAPEKYDAIPQDLTPLEDLLGDTSTTVRMEALKLIGRWKAKQFLELVSLQMEKAEDLNEKREVLKAMIANGAEKRIKELAQNASGNEDRVAAILVWTENDPKASVNNAVDLLQEIESEKLAELIFQSFCRLDGGPDILSHALQGKRLSENIAGIGLNVVLSSGLDLQMLEDNLRIVGSIQPIGMEMTKEEKEVLIADAGSLGNNSRGRQIFRRKELLCATCHRIDGIGGLSGPDLTTVGTYMTSNSILESLLNPNSDIKQNYETVILKKNNGEMVSGLLHRKTNNATLLRQANSAIIEIPATEISEMNVSPVSLMPPGLTSSLTKGELMDLLAYLTSLGVEN